MIGSYGFDPLNMGTDPAVLARFQVRSLPIPLSLSLPVSSDTILIHPRMLTDTDR